MLSFESEKVINAPVGKVSEWFRHMDRNYKTWHPRDHMGLRIIEGPARLQQDSVLRATERLGSRVLNYTLRVSKVISNKEIQWRATFPFNLVNLHGGFILEEMDMKTHWTATLHYGWPIPVIGGVLDKISDRFIRREIVAKHFAEEGEYLKRAIERQVS
jgi:hypothetical protein